MVNGAVREVRSRREWASDISKSYEAEKLRQCLRTHIHISKESEYSQVNRSIRKFSAMYNIEFDTIFKMYKIQNYKITPNLFKGTSYKYNYLSLLKSKVKTATQGQINYSAKDPMYNIIYAFISEIKGCSKPFPDLFDGTKNALALIDSGTLTKQETEFLQSRIISRKTPCTDDERSFSKVTLQKKGVKMINKEKTKKSTKSTKSTRSRWGSELYNIIANNYHLGCAKVKELTKHLSVNEKTLTAYISMCRRLEQGRIGSSSHMPTSLISAWKQRTPSTSQVKTNSKPKISIVSCKDYLLLDEVSNEILSFGSNEQYLEGYKAASGRNSLKIYKAI